MKLSWDKDVCMHAGNCVKGLPQVFKVEDGKFVIDENGAPDEDIKKAIASCPSGAIKAAD
jgi:uncharacterized Fe-S cluster protein YjdI|tara:strand:- start:61 stop:240 length:180 start_codon:yes stop_codon:yes gene_type:complete